MKCIRSGPANQNSQYWLSWSQQYNLEILFKKCQIDFMYLFNKYVYLTIIPQTVGEIPANNFFITTVLGCLTIFKAI